MTLGNQLISTLIAGCLCLTASAQASDLGKQLPALTFKDSKGQSQTLNPDLRRLYLSADRQGGGLIKEAMKGLSQTDLDAQQAAAIADISDAPGFVRRLIRGSLEDRSYRTWMDESGHSRPHLPYREKRVTVVDLEQMTITAIRHLGDVDALRAELQADTTPTLPATGAPSAAASPPASDAER